MRFGTKPHRQRAHLVVLTRQGSGAVKAGEQRQRLWARDLTAELTLERVTAVPIHCPNL
jgi:hypothetical protein